MKQKFLTAIVSILILFTASISTSCISDDDDWNEYVGNNDASYDDDEDISNFDSRSREVLELVNRERASRGVSPLRLVRDLNDAANIRAEEISEVFSHDRPDGSSCFTVIKTSYRNIGENIAAGDSTPAEVVEQWMNSPGHRANILNEDFTELGVGYFYESDSEYENYWVQLFRRR